MDALQELVTTEINTRLAEMTQAGLRTALKQGEVLKTAGGGLRFVGKQASKLKDKKRAVAMLKRQAKLKLNAGYDPDTRAALVQEIAGALAGVAQSAAGSAAAGTINTVRSGKRSTPRRTTKLREARTASDKKVLSKYAKVGAGAGGAALGIPMAARAAQVYHKMSHTGRGAKGYGKSGALFTAGATALGTGIGAAAGLGVGEVRNRAHDYIQRSIRNKVRNRGRTTKLREATLTELAKTLAKSASMANPATAPAHMSKRATGVVKNLLNR